MTSIKHKDDIEMSSTITEVKFGKYKGSRYWAIWINDHLLAVTVYRKGALAILTYLGLKDVAIEERPPKLGSRWR